MVEGIMLDISEALTRVISKLDVSFTLRSEPISIKNVLAPSGLLPAIARRADQTANLCLNYGIGISFEEAEESELGVQVRFDNVTPQTLRLMCMYDVILDIIGYSDDENVVALDELLFD